MKSHFWKGEAKLINFDCLTYSGLEAWADDEFVQYVISC